MTKKVAIIIFLVLLFAVVGGVYLFLGKKTPVSPQQSPAKKLTEIKIANWKTYQNKDFSFQYPQDWKVDTQGAETISNIVLPTIPTNASNSAQAITPPEGGSVTIQTVTASQSAQQFTSSIFAPATKLKLGKTEIQTYVLKQQGALINYLIFPYDTTVTSYILSFDYYNYQHPDWDYPALFDQMISSFKFTDEK